MTDLLKFKIVLAGLFLIAGCREQVLDGLAKERSVLEQMGFRSDTSRNAIIREALKGINCLAATASSYRLVLASEYNDEDTCHILVIPFSSSFTEYKSQAYSHLATRVILLNPQQIELYGKTSSLSDTTVTPALVSLALLHETGHFLLGIDGAYDSVADTTNSKLGEQVMDTDPEYLTSVKRMEMNVDSMVIVMVKGSILSKDMDCYGCASSVQLLLPGMSYQLFGTRLLAQFSRPLKILRDPSASHPNMELRIAFMNYYLNPTEQGRQMIDEFLYDREVAPIKLQELDPRIYHGDEKILPGDK